MGCSGLSRSVRAAAWKLVLIRRHSSYGVKPRMLFMVIERFADNDMVPHLPAGTTIGAMLPMDWSTSTAGSNRTLPAASS